MQKRLLVLAAGILQVPIIKRAYEMGIYVIAADGDPNACGLKYADKAIVANITSEEDMLRVAREENIDGVIHPCSEVSMSVMGRINDELHLSGISKDQAIRATNKHLMREAFERQVRQAPSRSALIMRMMHGNASARNSKVMAYLSLLSTVVLEVLPKLVLASRWTSSLACLRFRRMRVETSR